MGYTLPFMDDIAQPELAAKLQQRLDQKTKPLGSLGRLETLAKHIGLVLGSEQPLLREPQLVVMRRSLVSSAGSAAGRTRTIPIATRQLCAMFGREMRKSPAISATPIPARWRGSAPVESHYQATSA